MKLFQSIFGGRERVGRYPETLIDMAIERAVDGTDPRLLLAHRQERNVLGMDLMGDQVRRDVAQVSVSFSGHRLLEPRINEDESRRFLKRRAFDYLLVLALGEITETGVQREDLKRQRDLLQRKLWAMQRGSLPLTIDTRDLPRREDLVTAAERYL